MQRRRAFNSPSAASYDPQYCYILDGILLLYGIIITAFFVRERCIKKKSKGDQDPLYQPINKSGQSAYDVLQQRSAEEGGTRGGRRRGDDSTYTVRTSSLQEGSLLAALRRRMIQPKPQKHLRRQTIAHQHELQLNDSHKHITTSTHFMFIRSFQSTPLQKKTEETYREIETKPGRRRPDQVYQGLSSVTKDTYDSLNMQQIHPPPR
ncbi:T-cell surface glycoprotein CD3 zeta chain [Labeo rohita]|uniref:T-cell surface glycoprotein CD3 zeta chain n=1 Tax=Labeo rohita TaxID=84645 RepID=A0ABQ8N1I9_LABRO|nr:T-cell surface glycoprotein CD3 zeta chain [Labeo rohita]